MKLNLTYLQFYFSILFFITLPYAEGIAQVVPVNSGNYNLSVCPGCPPSPGQWDGSWFNAMANPPRVVPGFSQIPPTHEWWTSFLWDPGLSTTHSTDTWSYPHSIRADSFGLQVYKNRLDNIQNVFPQKYNYQSWPNQGINVGVQNMKSDSTWVVNYGDFHLKARWKDNNGRQLDAMIANGCPYVYFEQQGSDSIEIWLTWDPVIDNVIGTNVLGFSVQGSNYGIFAPSGCTWVQLPKGQGNWAGQGINCFKTKLNGKNYFAVAPLPDTDPSTLQKFADHAFVFVTGTTINYSFNEASATLTTTFTYSTTVKEGTQTLPIVGMLPHHWKNSTTPTNGIIFDTPRGEMHCLDGATFSMQLSNFGVLPQLPLTGNFPDLYKYVTDQMVDTQYVNSGDNYIGGKQIAKLANITEVAHYVGHTAAFNQFLTQLKAALEDWLTSPNGENDGAYLYYNPLWHTLTPYTGDLGPQLLNDHHFSIGYILRGAATIAKFDQTWAQTNNWGAMVNMMIRHVDAWDRNDPIFPFMRFHSPYVGHSFSGGSSERPGGNGQESSSEAINFAASVFFWGLNTHDTTIRNLGMYLYLTEVKTAKEYWWDVENTNFPPTFTANQIWNIDGLSSGKWTWFGGRPEYGIGINVSLMDAHLLYLAHDTTYSRQVYNQFVSDIQTYDNNPSETQEQVWQDAIWAWRATYEPTTILAKYNALEPFPYQVNPWNHIEWSDPALGNFNDQPPVHFYHWIHALDSLGWVNPTVTANYSSYGVFDKNSCRHYVMYNPPGEPARTVTFSDGKSFSLPVDTTITYKVCPTALPVQWLNFQAERNGQQVKLTWETSSEKNNQYFVIQRKGEDGNFEDIGILSGNKTSKNISSYVYYDTNPLENNYYRLKQVDINGAFTYSDIRYVDFDSKGTITIYPIPAKDQLTIRYSGNAQIESIYITDVLGRMVLESDSPAPSASSVELNVSQLSGGAYFVYVVIENESPFIKKIMIVRN
ncbi:MAG TPA: glycosyl hydrolase [Cytophagaceae bacterium]|jgi:endoglucanase Acf2|nr:glycosyl hydrolase [Cytophagaceae bacterium]